MNFDERLNMFLEGGMINQQDADDINSVIKMFKEKYHVVLEEENADFFINHLCAAFSRKVTNEEVMPLPEEAKKELLELDSYEKSLEILNDVMKVIHNDLNDTELDYVLLHINNLITKLSI